MILPDFIQPFLSRPELGGALYATREEAVAAQARAHRDAHGIRPASSDRERVIAVPIDVQVGFCMDPAFAPPLPFPTGGGSLHVPGSGADTTRAAAFLLRNLERITAIRPSLDTHRVHQVFHADFWRDETGAPPPPFTVMEVQGESVLGRLPDGSARPFTARLDPALGLAYCRALAEQGAAPLSIWPYHCRLGSTHHALMPLLSEVQLFWAIARQAADPVDLKGQQTWTESYGIVGDEVESLAGQRVGDSERPGYIDALLHYDRVVLFGQALSHCVRATVDQIAAAFTARGAALSRLVVLQDCCSPVPAIPGFEQDPDSPLNFPVVGRAALDRWRAQGIQVIDSTQDLP